VVEAQAAFDLLVCAVAGVALFDEEGTDALFEEIAVLARAEKAARDEQAQPGQREGTRTLKQAGMKLGATHDEQVKTTSSGHLFRPF
jgi:hypothetical protein